MPQVYTYHTSESSSPDMLTHWSQVLHFPCAMPCAHLCTRPEMDVIWLKDSLSCYMYLTGWQNPSLSSARPLHLKNKYSNMADFSLYCRKVCQPGSVDGTYMHMLPTYFGVNWHNVDYILWIYIYTFAPLSHLNYWWSLFQNKWNDLLETCNSLEMYEHISLMTLDSLLKCIFGVHDMNVQLQG